MSFKPEVIADSSGKWSGNALRFATEEEARIYVDDLMMRWTAVRDTRVVEVDEPVTARLDRDGSGWRSSISLQRDRRPPSRRVREGVSACLQSAGRRSIMNTSDDPLRERGVTTLDARLFLNADADGVEPDARHHACDSCGLLAVFGAEEVLLMIA